MPVLILDDIGMSPYMVDSGQRFWRNPTKPHDQAATYCVHL